MDERHPLLRAELAAQAIQLCITPHVLVDDRDSGAGLLDVLTVTMARSGEEPRDLTGTFFKPLPEMHARHAQTRGNRIAMIRDGRFRSVTTFASELGDASYERLEAAALDDASVPTGQLTQESRFEYLRVFSLRDPNTNISDAIHAKFVPDLLEKHRVNDWGHLGCPYCERFFPREELAVVSYREPTTDFAGVA